MLRSLLLALALALAVAGSAAAQGVTDSQIVLGQSVALTGPAQQLGLDMQLGATLYFNQVNARGGVNGRKIVLKTLDDGYEAPRAAENTKKLINDERVFALFGYVGTPTSQASLPIFTEAKVPFVGPFTGAELLRTPVNPLHLQRPRELLRRDRGDRPAPHRHEREQDRGLLPERRVRHGGPRRRGARAEEARPRDRRQGHRRAQHGRGEEGDRRNQQGEPAGGRDDQRLQVVRGVHQGHEEGGRQSHVLERVLRRQQGARRRSSTRKAAACRSPRSFRSPGMAPCPW